MNSLPPDDDQLDAFLRTPPAALPDAGFTAQVLAALPSPAPHLQRTSRLRVIFVGTGALVGLGSLLLGQHDWSAIGVSAESISVALTRATDPLTDPLVVTALLLAAGSLAVAFHAEIRERLLD